MRCKWHLKMTKIQNRHKKITPSKWNHIRKTLERTKNICNVKYEIKNSFNENKI